MGGGVVSNGKIGETSMEIETDTKDFCAQTSRRPI